MTRLGAPVTIADEVKMHDELVALMDEVNDAQRKDQSWFSAHPNDARITELTEKLCSTASGRKLLDGHLQSTLSSALDARGDVPEPGSKKALERKN
jgi:hypothetical protein